jgi:excisionase family DNA binding protein
MGGTTIMTVTDPAAQPGQQSGGTRLYRIHEVLQLLPLSRSVLYEQIRSGRLRSVKQGRARLVSEKAIRDYIALLETEAQHDHTHNNHNGSAASSGGEGSGA